MFFFCPVTAHSWLGGGRGQSYCCFGVSAFPHLRSSQGPPRLSRPRFAWGFFTRGESWVGLVQAGWILPGARSRCVEAGVLDGPVEEV